MGFRHELHLFATAKMGIFPVCRPVYRPSSPFFRHDKYLIFRFLQKNACSSTKNYELCKTFDVLNPTEYRQQMYGKRVIFLNKTNFMK